MSSKKSEAKLTATSAQVNVSDHDYTPMETSGSSYGKRKDHTPTPTKSSVPPNKIKASQEPKEHPSALVEAIEKLTMKMDTFGEQLQETTVMVASVAKLAEINAAEIKECKAQLKAVEKEMPQLIRENKELTERVTEMERYKRRWNLKIQGLKEKENEQIRQEIISILSEIAPQWAASMETVIDSVHRLGKREERGHRQVIIQFVMRHQRDEIWRLTKNSKFCKEAGIRFKQDFCKADREARAAVWPKMEQARSAGKSIYYRGHMDFIDGKRVLVDT